MFDGIVLTDKVKPFAVVEQMREYDDQIAAGRKDYEDAFGFQIGLYANSVSERSILSEKIKRAIRHDNIPFYDTSGSTPISAGFFVCDLNMVTPIPAEDSADNTNKHRIYFDVDVTVYRNYDGNTFTQ